MNFIRRLRLKDILWLSFAVGFGIESVQLLMTLILRYPYRVVDINDVWLNAVGGLDRIRAVPSLRLAVSIGSAPSDQALNIEGCSLTFAAVADPSDESSIR